MKHRIPLTALGAAGLVLAGVGALPASAAPARAAVDVCSVRALHVKALDLRDDKQGTDEVFLRFGDTRTPTRPYHLNQLRNTLSEGTGIFTGSENVKLVEEGPGKAIIGSATLPCVTDTETTILTNGDAIYEVRWTVQVL